MALEQELETYKQELPRLLADQGKFVLITGTEVVDVFETYEAALQAGYTKNGTKTPFMVKKILAHEPVHFITRMFAPVPCL